MVSTYPSEKWWSESQWVSDDIPYMKWNIIQSCSKHFQTRCYRTSIPSINQWFTIFNHSKSKIWRFLPSHSQLPCHRRAMWSFAHPRPLLRPASSLASVTAVFDVVFLFYPLVNIQKTMENHHVPMFNDGLTQNDVFVWWRLLLWLCFSVLIPSVYLTVCHGKSQFLIGKPSISMGHVPWLC